MTAAVNLILASLGCAHTIQALVLAAVTHRLATTHTNNKKLELEARPARRGRRKEGEATDGKDDDAATAPAFSRKYWTGAAQAFVLAEGAPKTVSSPRVVTHRPM